MPTRKLTITSCSAVYEGTNTRGDPSTIFEIEADDENGVAISLPLRSFHDLPLAPGEFEVERYEKNGRVSFTLKPPAGSRGHNGGVSPAQVAELVKRVEALERGSVTPAGDLDSDPLPF
jgi:hypothetical protein